MNVTTGTLALMIKQGGSFVCALADCYYRADPTNRAILRNAFAHVFDKYEAAYLQSQAIHKELAHG